MEKIWSIKMTDKNHFDVLMIKENRNSIDIIQTMIGDECLGVFFEEPCVFVNFMVLFGTEVDF